jgi:PTH1 family peptidyl-tRNA hydrolase
MPYLLAGLGNPGKEYMHTRHNIGQLVVDNLLKKLNIYKNMKKSIGEFWVTDINNDNIYLYKPLCYMNESGSYIAKALNKYNIQINNLVIIHDDKDIPFGNIKFKFSGSSGGHRGIQSIINSVGKDFVRLKCGIGRCDIVDTAEFVLSNFICEERKMLSAFLEYVAEAVLYFVNNGLSNAMNLYNKRARKNQ